MKKILTICILLLVFTIGCMCSTSDGKVYYNCYGNILPCANLTYNLGSDSFFWHDAFIEATHTKVIDSDGQDLYVECTGNHTLVLSEPVYDDLSIAMSQARTPASLAPVWTPYQGCQVPAFSDSQVNVLYFSAQLPHTYAEGTDIEFHIHIAYPDNGGGNSVWYFTYSWADYNDTFPAPSNSGQVIVASPATTDYHQKAEIIASIDGTGKTISSVLLCSIQRTGTHISDDYANVIYLVSGDFHYQIDTIGSRTITAK